MINFCDTSVDNELMKIEGLKYLPWIGKDYFQKPSKKRNFIIAESVYNWSDADEDNEDYINASLMLESNQFVRKDLIFKHGLYHLSNGEGRANVKIVRNSERTITGKQSITDHEREKFWRSSCFHEFVQRPLSCLEDRPTNEDYQLGASIILPLISIFQPSTILFFNADTTKVSIVANELDVDVLRPWDDYKMNGTIGKKMVIKNGRKTCNIICIKHPSSYFSFDKWHEFFNEVSNM